LLFLSLILFCFDCWAENTQSNVSGSPIIYFPEVTKDFGNVTSGATLEHDFIVENAGSADLIIRSFNPSCGCTSAVLNDPIIKPKLKSSVRVTFNTAGFNGLKEKTIRIYSNDPSKSSMVISVKANILKDIEVSPERLDLGLINQREGFNKQLQISKSLKVAPFTITEVVSKLPFIGTEYVKNGADGYVLKLFTEGLIPLGKHKTRLIIKTDSATSPQIIVPISFFVQGEIIAVPKAINFGLLKRSVSPSDSMMKIVRLNKSSESVATKVMSVEKSSRGVDVDLAEDAEGQYVRISVNSLASGVVRGVLRLQTDSKVEDGKLIEIPYFALVEAD
jgi:hypothetical protein